VDSALIRQNCSRSTQTVIQWTSELENWIEFVQL